MNSSKISSEPSVLSMQEGKNLLEKEGGER